MRDSLQQTDTCRLTDSVRETATFIDEDYRLKPALPFPIVLSDTFCYRTKGSNKTGAIPVRSQSAIFRRDPVRFLDTMMVKDLSSNCLSLSPLSVRFGLRRG